MQKNLDSILEQHLTQQPKFWKILLLGDSCEDIYVYGTVDRISPEAPVPVFVKTHEFSKPGMASNVNLNLQNLGCSVDFLHTQTSTKTRFIDLRSNQQIMRLDNDAKCIAITLKDTIPPVYDAVVISDYNKGTITSDLIKTVLNTYNGPVFLDTKKTDVSDFDNAIIKLNAFEVSKLVKKPKNLIITLGNQGAEYDNIIYSVPKVEVSDVCGAGDTFLSALVYKYLCTLSIPKSIEFANRAASITVQHIGVYAPKLKEIDET